MALTPEERAEAVRELMAVIHELMELLIAKWRAHTEVSMDDVAAIYDRWQLPPLGRGIVADQMYRIVAQSDPDLDADALQRWRVIFGASRPDAVN